jgi:acetyl-CoA/propionyl-CoA carboxylase, biotin carboxylase, biotin carboxyl carrier protein
VGLEPAGPVVDPFEVADGWSNAGAREWTVAFRVDGRPLPVAVRGHVRAGATVRVGDGPSVHVRAEPSRAIDAEPVGTRPSPLSVLSVSIDGTATSWRTAVEGDDVWVSRRGDAWRFGPDRAARGEDTAHLGAAGPVTSPMPGVVVAVHVAVGDPVRAGQPLVAIEAMKMEHAVVAPGDGVVAELLVRPGQSVGLDEVLARIEAADEHDAGLAVGADGGDV